MPAQSFVRTKTILPVIWRSNETRKPKARKSSRNKLTLPPLQTASQHVDPQKSRNPKTKATKICNLQQEKIQAALQRLRQSKPESAPSELERGLTPQQRECMLITAAQESVNLRLTRAIRRWADHNYCQLEEDPINFALSTTNLSEDTAGHYPSGFGFFLSPDGTYTREAEPSLSIVYDTIMSLSDKETQDRLLCFLNDFIIRRSLYRWACSKRTSLLVEIANWLGQILNDRGFRTDEEPEGVNNILQAGEGLGRCYMKTYNEMLMLQFIRKMLGYAVEYLLMTPEETDRLQEVMDDASVQLMTHNADPSPANSTTELSTIDGIIKMSTTDDNKRMIDCLEVIFFCVIKGVDDTEAAIIRTENDIQAKKDAITRLQIEAEGFAKAQREYEKRAEKLEKELLALNRLAATKPEIPTKVTVDAAVQTLSSPESNEKEPKTPQPSPLSSARQTKKETPPSKGRSPQGLKATTRSPHTSVSQNPSTNNKAQSTAKRERNDNENANRTREDNESSDKTKAQNRQGVTNESTAPHESTSEQIPARSQSSQNASGVVQRSRRADSNKESRELLSGTSHISQSRSSTQNIDEHLRRTEKHHGKETPVHDRRKSDQSGQRKTSNKISRLGQKTSIKVINEEVDEGIMIEMLHILVNNLLGHTQILESCLKRLKLIAQREVKKLHRKQGKIMLLVKSLRSAWAAIAKQTKTLPFLVFEDEKVFFTNRASSGHKCRFCSCHLFPGDQQEVVVNTRKAAEAVGKTLSHCACFSELLADVRSSYQDLCTKLCEVEKLVTTSVQKLSQQHDLPDSLEDVPYSLPEKSLSDVTVMLFSSVEEGLGKVTVVASFVQTLTGYVLEAEAEATVRLQKLQEQSVLVDQMELEFNSAQQLFQITAKQVAEMRCRSDFLLVGKILRDCYCRFCQCYISPFLVQKAPRPDSSSGGSMLALRPPPMPARPHEELWPALMRATASLRQGLGAVQLRGPPIAPSPPDAPGVQGQGASEGQDEAPEVCVVSALDPLVLADIVQAGNVLGTALKEAVPSSSPASTHARFSNSLEARSRSHPSSSS